MSLQSDRLRAARLKAGFPKAIDAIRKFEWEEGTYRHHDNGTRPFKWESAKIYARAFKVKPGWLMGYAGVDGEAPAERVDDGRLTVDGAVAAGVWREAEQWNDDRSFVIEDMPNPVPETKRFGLVVEGYSMDEEYQPGTVLDCVSLFRPGEPIRPANGDHVIVERVRPDGLRELTVKEYLHENGKFYLVPRSTKAEFQPIEIGEPDRDISTDEQVRVIAFVVGNLKPRALELLRRLGKISSIS